jgi:hypothetical protein
MTSQPTSPISPWPDAARWHLIFSTAAAVIVCGLAWLGAAGEARVGDQLIFATISVAGVVISLCANLSWIMRARRSVGDRARALLGDVPAGSETPIGPAPARDVVAGAGMRFYHRPECLLVRGRRWSITPAAEQVAAGRAPCGVCRP